MIVTRTLNPILAIPTIGSLGDDNHNNNHNSDKNLEPATVIVMTTANHHRMVLLPSQPTNHATLTTKIDVD